MKFRNGLASLLRPEDSVLVLIDHQPYQLANLNSHDPHVAVNNATALARMPSSAISETTGLASGAYSPSAAWAMALKALLTVIAKGRPSVNSGS